MWHGGDDGGDDDVEVEMDVNENLDELIMKMKLHMLRNLMMFMMMMPHIVLSLWNNWQHTGRFQVGMELFCPLRPVQIKYN